uniref:Uncharacterized protein n=1 Tax=Lotharella globosa TaxID=91324 RepID=A0A6V3J4M6_9EUKA|mmetsp:Transcript_14758/g.29918  ORF Transcript_14758/g.29918 Transcript_14758/m.29918 type:complete len:269 (+) Transcript_14758:424-1230(+)
MDLKNMGAGWEALPPMSVGREKFGITYADGKLYAVGGTSWPPGWDISEAKDVLRSAEFLELRNVGAGWKQLPQMNTPRYGVGLVHADGKLFAIGGSLDSKDSYPTLRSVEFLDLKNVDAGWKEFPPLMEAMYGDGVAHVDGKLFVLSGKLRRNREDENHRCECLDLNDVNAGWKQLPLRWKSVKRASVITGDGKLLAIWDFDGNPRAVGELDLKNIGAGWENLTRLTPMEGFRKPWDSVVYADGNLFLFGGILDFSSPGSVECMRVSM